MPEIAQHTSLDLYSEQLCKEAIIEIGENIIVEESKYSLTVILTIPETYLNSQIPGVNIEIFADDHRIGKGYKNLRKTEGFAKVFKKTLQDTLVILGITDDSQLVKVHIPIQLPIESRFLKIQVFPENLQIEEASARFDVKLTGIRYILYEYFSTSLTFGVFWIVLIQVLIGFYVKKKVTLT